MAPSDRQTIAILRRYALQIGRIYQRHVLSALKAWTRARVARADAAEPSFELFAEDVESLAAVLRQSLRVAEREVARVPQPVVAYAKDMERVGLQASRAERAQLVAAGADPGRLAAAIGVPRDGLVGINIAATAAEEETILAHVREGLDLIKSLTTEQLEGYEETIGRMVIQGRRVETIQNELSSRLEIDARHAELIARDQVGKLNGAITKTLQEKASIDRYVWRATADSRTRDSHRAVADQVWAWSSPPPGTGPYDEAAHPGEAIQCRCTAEPVIPDDLRADYGLSGPGPQVGDTVPL